MARSTSTSQADGFAGANAKKRRRLASVGMTGWGGRAEGKSARRMRGAVNVATLAARAEAMPLQNQNRIGVGFALCRDGAQRAAPLHEQVQQRRRAQRLAAPFVCEAEI